MITRYQAKVKKHMIAAHNVKVEVNLLSRKFSFSLCPYITRDMEELKNHLIIEHKKEKHNWMVEEIRADFTCDKCGLPL